MSRFNLSVLVVLGFGPAGLASSGLTRAHAETALQTPEAVLSAAPYTLHIDTSCAASIRIQGAGPLKQNADMHDIPSGLSFQVDSHDAWLRGAACGEDATIQVREGTAIVSTTAQYDDLTVSWVYGPVSTLQGHGDLRIDHATALLYRGNGSGDLTLDSLTGPAVLALSGPGDVRINHANAPDVVSSQTGSSNLTIRNGSIDRLMIALSGPGDATFNGTARIAALQTHGSGDIRVQQILENEQAYASSTGTIEVAERPAHATIVKRGTDTKDNTGILSHETKLPDGTRIDIHRLIRPDGTLIDFDALRHMSDIAKRPSNSLSPPTPPTPPEARALSAFAPTPPHPPAVPDSQASPVEPKAVASAKIDIDTGDSDIKTGLVVLVVLALVLLRRRIIPRLLPALHQANPRLGRRLEPFLLSLMNRPQHPQPSTQLPQLLELTERLKRLDKRVGHVEHCVTSRDFHLHRQFRDLDRRHG